MSRLSGVSLQGLLDTIVITICRFYPPCDSLVTECKLMTRFDYTIFTMPPRGCVETALYILGGENHTVPGRFIQEFLCTVEFLLQLKPLRPPGRRSSACDNVEEGGVCCSRRRVLKLSPILRTLLPRLLGSRTACYSCSSCRPLSRRSCLGSSSC